MCKGTTNWEDVHIIKKEIIPTKTLEKLNVGWITNHGGIPVDKCIGKEIETLIISGVVTGGSCCGHGEYNAHALADESEMDKIELLGYEVKPFRWGLVQFNLKTGTQI